MKMVLFEAFCHGMRRNQKPTVIPHPVSFCSECSKGMGSLGLGLPRSWDFREGHLKRVS